jgi:protein-disulfide isomerase
MHQRSAGGSLGFLALCAATLLLATTTAPRIVSASAPAPPAEPVVERHSPMKGSPSLGPLDAATTLVFFTDYQCPVCPRAAREMSQLVTDMKGTVRVELRHHPLAMHRDALDAAAASRAAQRQGKFWEYHGLLLDATRHDRASLTELARTIGLDEQAFLRDLDDPKLRQGILDEAEEAQQAGADGTPGFLINGHVEVGWASLGWLEQIVRQQMSRSHGDR